MLSFPAWWRASSTQEYFYGPLLFPTLVFQEDSQLLFVLPSTALNLSRGCHDEKSAETALDTSVMPGGDEVLISACGGYSFLAKIGSFDDVVSKILGRREHSPEVTKSSVQA